jgi:hypothetical protein
MGWCNYLVDDENKIKYELNRSLQVEDIDNLLDNIQKIWKNYERMQGRDVYYKKIDDYTKHLLMDTGLCMYDVMVSCMDEYLFYEYMLVLLYKNREKSFRIISEFELDAEGEPADEYKTISRW